MTDFRNNDSYPQFSVKPYSHFPRGKADFDMAKQCAICGKLLGSKGRWAAVAGGGSRWATTGDGPEGPGAGGWMGLHFIGSECWARYYTHNVPVQSHHQTADV